LRLQARGVSPQVTQPIRVNVSDVASPAARNAQILNMMPYLIIIFIMAGGMYLAIDTTAGERENGSLEPLLTLPVNRKTILIAKLCATVVYSALTFLLVLLGLTLAFEYAPIDSIDISISMAQVAKVFLTCLPFVFVASALMVLVASFTRSYKEAQSYLSMVMLVPSLPLVVLGFLSPAPSSSNMWIPSLSQGLIIIETLKGEVISNSLIILSMISSLVFAALLAAIAVKLYQREKILG
jgi:sodium transport system permease protein